MGQWDQKYGADAQRREDLNSMSDGRLQDLYCNMTGVWFGCHEAGKFVEGTVPPNRPQDPGVKQDMITEIIRQEHLRKERSRDEW